MGAQSRLSSGFFSPISIWASWRCLGDLCHHRSPLALRLRSECGRTSPLALRLRSECGSTRKQPRRGQKRPEETFLSPMVCKPVASRPAQRLLQGVPNIDIWILSVACVCFLIAHFYCNGPCCQLLDAGLFRSLQEWGKMKTKPEGSTQEGTQTQSLYIKKIVPPKLLIARLWRPYW